MANKTDKRKSSKAEIELAEKMYCESNYTLERIAIALDKNIKTIATWRDKYGWDDTRRMFETSPLEFKKLLLAEATRIVKGETRKDENGEEIPKIDADSLSKVMKAYDYMNSKTSASVCYQVLTELDTFTSSIDPKRAAENTDLHKQFLINKIEQENA